MSREGTGTIVKRIVVLIVNIVLALGAFVPFVVDMLVNHRPTWSIIVLGAVAMTWLILAPWFSLDRNRFAASWLAALIAVPAYLYLIEAVTAGKGWFLALGLPAALIGLAGVGVTGWLWLYSRVRPLYAASLTLLAAAGVNFGEFWVTRAFVQTDPVAWAHMLTTVCLVGVAALTGVIGASVHGRSLVRPSGSE